MAGTERGSPAARLIVQTSPLWGGIAWVSRYTCAMSQYAEQHLPHSLDVAGFALHQGQMAGMNSVQDWPRLAQAEYAQGPGGAGESQIQGQAGVQWQLRGETRSVGGEVQPWVHLQAKAGLNLQCQRCLQGVFLEVQAHRSARFVADEGDAAALDLDSEEDVLALEPHFNALEWIEDELLLALPLVPMHERCPEPLPLPQDEGVPEPENPFAKLALLKKGGGHA